MTEEIKAKIEGLRHGVYLCDSKNLSFKNDGYRSAISEMKISLLAAIERLENGEQMESIAIAD
jgi:hypothetical protein